MKKLRIILLFFAVLLFISACGKKDRETKKPNILFILADDMGWQDTSVPFSLEITPFNKRYQTPALERLTKEGAKFTQSYSCAVCSPSRVSLMTGLNEARHHVTQWTYLSGDKPSSDIGHPTLLTANWNWNGLQPEPGMEHAISVETLPELLKKAGYRTMIFGKGHLGAAGTSGADPKNFGFDVRVGGRDGGGCASYYGAENFGAKAHPRGPWRAWDMDNYFAQDIHLTEALTLEAKTEIRKAVENGESFFCYFAHFAPHTPIKPDERFAPKYRDAGLDDTEAAYASLIEGVDKSTGDLLDLLDELEISENTIVVFTSDNGGVSHAYRSMSLRHTHNAPLSSGKGAHHEGGIRVPLIVRWPGVTNEGETNETPVILYDWYPTLLEAAGVEYSANVDGISLNSILSNNEEVKVLDRPIVWHFPNFWGPLNLESPVEGPGMGPSSTIRIGDWKLIYYHTDQSFELFYLKDDLGEKNNLVDRKPEKAKDLAIELSNYLQKNNAPMPRSKISGDPVPYPKDVIDNYLNTEFKNN